MIVTEYAAQPLHFFESEAQAVDWTVTLLRKFGFYSEREKTLKNRLRCDLYVRMQDGEIEFPMEIKKELTHAKHFRKAIAQAADYANEVKLPAFIGPVVFKTEWERRKQLSGAMNPEIQRLQWLLMLTQDRRIHDYLLFAMQQNVGFIETDTEMSYLCVRLEPDFKFIFDSRGRNEQYRPQFWGWRESRGSNFNFTGLSLLGDPR